MSVKVENAMPKLKDALSSNRIMYQLSTQVLEDCNRYARKMTGHLIQTSRFGSDKYAGVLRWTTPYAVRVYYTGTPSTEFNPNARLMWCDYAASVHGGEWVKLLASMIQEELEK